MGNPGHGPSRTFSDLPPSLIIVLTRKKEFFLVICFLQLSIFSEIDHLLSVLYLLRLYAAVLFIVSGDLVIHMGRRFKLRVVGIYIQGTISQGCGIV